MARAQLRETKLQDGTPVWFLEWEVRQRRRKKILLAVDTSDSCTGEREQLKSFLRVLLDVLDLGDSCALWLVGSSEKILDERIDHSQQRSEIAQRLMLASLKSVRRGTWLVETLNAMLREAGNTPPEVSCYFLLISDGEVFDVEALQQQFPKSFGFLRLGRRVSNQLETLIKCATAVQSNEQSLKRFLIESPVSIVFEPAAEDSRLLEFSEQGEIVRQLDSNDGIEIGAERTMIRVAYVGGRQPQPRLRYQASQQAWEIAEIDRTRVMEPHLQQVRRALEGNKVNWDLNRLELLAEDVKKVQKLQCPICNRSNLARKSLFCTCGSLLVSLDGIKKPDVLRLYQGTICFPFNGGVIAKSPYPCSGSPSDHAYETENERLMVDLYK